MFGKGETSLQELSNSQPVAEFTEPSLPRLHIIIHGACLFFTFIGICTMGAVAGFQGKWFGVSGGSAFTLFLLLVSFALSLALLLIPVIYDRYDKGRRAAQFLSQARSTFILHVFGSTLMLLAAFIVTISVWTNAGCKNPDNDKHQDLGDDYKNGLKGWCRTKKASAIFDWLAVAAWLGLTALSGIAFRNERRVSRRAEPGFAPPDSPGFNSGNGMYSQLGGDEESNVFADKHEEQSPVAGGAQYTSGPLHAAPKPYAYPAPAGVAADSAMARPSMDAYGAFDGDMPGAMGHGGAAHGEGEPSRTLQMAFQDPYAEVRQNVLNDGYAPHGGAYPPAGGNAYPAAANYR